MKKVLANSKITIIYVLICILAIFIVFILQQVFSTTKQNDQLIVNNPMNYKELYFKECDKKGIPRKHSEGLYNAYISKGTTPKEMYEAALEWDKWSLY